MVSPTSRRGFLFGRRTAPTQWGQFCARLARICAGQVRWDDQPDQQCAWLVPARQVDVLHARALCQEYRVQLVLAGTQRVQRQRPSDLLPPRLFVESGAAWAQLMPADDSGAVWRADAGCSMRSLQQVGIAAVQDADPEQTVAQWLASSDAARWPIGLGALSGIEELEVMLADGTVAQLGPFGANATRPLRSMTVQKMIPKLFELASSPEALASAQAEHWPVKFRLDALMPAAGEDVNLAWLMAGHAGQLGWVQTVWFKREGIETGRETLVQYAQSSEYLPVSVEGCVKLAQQLKALFDPAGIFP